MTARARFAAVVWPALLLVSVVAAIWYGTKPAQVSPDATSYQTTKLIMKCIPVNPYSGQPLATPLEIEAFRQLIDREITEQEFFALTDALGTSHSVVMCIYEQWLRDT